MMTKTINNHNHTNKPDIRAKQVSIGKGYYRFVPYLLGFARDNIVCDRLPGISLSLFCSVSFSLYLSLAVFALHSVRGRLHWRHSEDWNPLSGFTRTEITRRRIAVSWAIALAFRIHCTSAEKRWIVERCPKATRAKRIDFGLVLFSPILLTRPATISPCWKRMWQQEILLTVNGRMRSHTLPLSRSVRNTNVHYTKQKEW